MKADSLNALEGNSPVFTIGEHTGHHRGLRAGHVSTGVTWALGRTNCLLAREPEDRVYRFIKRPGAVMLRHLHITTSRPDRGIKSGRDTNKAVYARYRATIAS